MTTDTADLSMPAVEREITTLAGHLAAGTCRFLQLLAAFDSGGGWHGTGMRTCAQWLSWKCGLSTTAAREQLRVAHALEALPTVTAAFAAGRISYSKARALSRVATRESETELLATATGCTASQLDRLCAGLARARSSEGVLDQAARASFRAVWEDDGMLRISGRLTPEDGAVLLAALAEVREPAVTDPDGSGEPLAAAGPARTAGPQPGASAEAPAAGSEPGMPGDGCRDAGARAARSDAAALVALARHALDQPPAASTSAPVRLVVHTTEAAMHRGEADRDASAETPPPSGDADGETVSAEAPTAAVLDAGPGVPLLPLGPDTLRRLACQALVEPATHPDRGAGTEDEPAHGGNTAAGKAHHRQHRFATARQRRALLRRDGGCAFPGCPRRRNLHAHHRVHWSHGGPTTLENLVLTCEHHHLLLHEGGWQLRPHREGTGRRRWSAVHPDGRVMTPSPATSGDAGALHDSHDANIAPDTVTGTWTGEPLDLAYAVGVLAS